MLNLSPPSLFSYCLVLPLIFSDYLFSDWLVFLGSSHISHISRLYWISCFVSALVGLCRLFSPVLLLSRLSSLGSLISRIFYIFLSLSSRCSLGSRVSDHLSLVSSLFWVDCHFTNFVSLMLVSNLMSLILRDVFT